MEDLFLSISSYVAGKLRKSVRDLWKVSNLNLRNRDLFDMECEYFLLN